jgi:hypothetical protein
MDKPMTKYQCKTCEGVYSDVCEDGLQYYHACPPIEVSKDKYAERVDKRDENAGKKMEGLGRIKLEL